jgi:predicted lipoprotein with Yx(FWY)xxD motif
MPSYPTTNQQDPKAQRRRGKTVGLLFAAAVGLAACGSDPAPIAAPAGDSTEQAAETAAPAADQTASAAAVTSTESPLGDILVGSNGLVVYGFTNDVDATSACYGTCAEAWPPLIVDESWDVAPGLDSGIFNAVERDDGQLQLVAGKWPLYYFAGDTVPADLNGQGSGDVWFVVGTDGVLITDPVDGSEAADQSAEESAGGDEAAEQAIVSVGTTEAGDVLVDAAGLSLYGFLDDADGEPTCEGACADAWPPILVDSAELPSGLDADTFSVVERPDGTFQLKAGKWPLYLFAGDAAPGDINGQGSGDVWFLSAPDGSLIKDDGQAAADDGGDNQDDEDGDY